MNKHIPSFLQVHKEAASEMLKEVDRDGNPTCYERPTLYSNLPAWEPGKYSPYQLCR